MGRSFTYVYTAELGDPAEDLAVATVLMIVGGKLVLLRPRKVCTILYSDEVVHSAVASRRRVR